MAATWMDPEYAVLSQTEKDKSSMVSLTRGILKSQTHTNRVKWWLPEARGLGDKRDVV